MCKINGKKLAEIRENNGLTKTELGKRLGVSSQTISNYENGNTNPPDENVDKICMILKVSKGDIEIQNVGYNFLDGKSTTVKKVTERKGFIRYSTPEQTEKLISRERKLSEDEELSEIKNALRSSFGLGNKKYILIDPTLIHIPEWQRNTDMAKVEEIAENFNEDKFDPIKGYLTENNLINVADGAHRTLACIKNNHGKKDKMKVLVEILACNEHDAIITFLGQQSGRKTMTVCDTYAEVNTKSCYCEKCGYDGDIPLVEDSNGRLKWECPSCKNDDNTTMDIAFRVCGYIGTAKNGGNQGRYGDIHDRVYHVDDFEETEF